MQSSPNPYLTTLTPLRGIAALFVVIFHSNLMMETFLPPGYTQFVDSSWLWVDFFFVLSGFILSYVYGKHFKERTVRSTYKKYIGARFARVYPLHFFTLIWAVVCAMLFYHYAHRIDPFVQAILNIKAGAPACLFLVQAMHLLSTAPLNTPSWSLSTEWWVYMIFPFFVPFFSRIKMGGRAVVLVFVIGFFILLRYWLGPVSNGVPGIGFISDFAFFRCLAGFLLGMLLFSFYQAKTGYSLLKSSWCFVAFVLGIFIAMHFGAIDIIIVAFFPFIILTAAYNNTGVKKFLDKRPLQRLGDWSFSIYMVHIPLVMLRWIYHVYKEPDYYADLSKMPAPNYLLGVAACIILITLTLLTASFTYKYVEVPSRNYLNRKFDAKHKQISPEAVLV